MNHDEEDWKKQLDKFKVVQKCPKCGNLSLKYEKGKLVCGNCNFEQNIGEINESK
jgi:ribosomal protein S27AE